MQLFYHTGVVPHVKSAAEPTPPAITAMAALTMWQYGGSLLGQPSVAATTAVATTILPIFTITSLCCRICPQIPEDIGTGRLVSTPYAATISCIVLRHVKKSYLVSCLL